MLFKITILICALWQSCVHASFYTTSGISYSNKGELYVAGERMIIYSELDLQSLSDQMEVILRRVNTTRNRVTVMLPNDDSAIVPLKEKVVIQDLLSGIYSAAQKHYTDFTSYMSTVELTRNKRGLIDIGGKLFKALFGLSTEDDIAEIHKVLDYVASGYNDTLSQLNIHTVILNHTIDDIVNMTNHINLINDNIDMINTNLGDIIISIKEEKAITLLHLMTTQIINTLQSLEMDLIKLRSAIFSAYNGKLDPYLIPPNLAMQILRRAAQDPHVRLPFRITEANLPKFYSIANIIPFKKSNMVMSFSIIVPLLSDADIYEIYAIDTLPVPSDQTISVRVTLDDEYLAVSLDRRHFISLSNLDHCTSTHNTYLCPPISPIYDSSTKLCTISAFLGKSHIDICNTKIYVGDLAFLQRSDNKWLYSISPSKNATMLCIGKKPEFLELRGFGHLVLPNKCSLSIGNIVVPPMETIHLGNITLKVMEPIPLSPMFDVEEIETMQDFPTFNHSFVSGQSLADYKRDLKIIKLHRNQLFIHTTVGHTISFVAILISGTLLAFFVYSCYQERCKRAKAARLEQVVYHDVDGGDVSFRGHPDVPPIHSVSRFTRPIASNE